MWYCLHDPVKILDVTHTHRQTHTHTHDKHSVTWGKTQFWHKYL